MRESILEKIDRAKISTYIFRFSLLVFLIVTFAVIAFAIKINVFPASSSKGYIIFIIRNLLLSVILLVSYRYIKKNKTIFAISFDKANGHVKFFWLIGFTISLAIIYELLNTILSKII